MLFKAVSNAGTINTIFSKQMPNYCKNRTRLNVHMELHKHLKKQKKQLKKNSKYECIACTAKSQINYKFCFYK